MDFKVDYLRVFDIGEMLERENEELVKSLEKLAKIIEDLSQSWTGADYENFKTSTTAYIKSLNSTTADIEYISKFMQSASVTYSDDDAGWAKQIKEIGADTKWHTV